MEWSTLVSATTLSWTITHILQILLTVSHKTSTTNIFVQLQK